MWFRRRRRAEQQLFQRLDEITARLGAVLDMASAHKVQVTIQHLHVERATLDQLLFRLDRLDIDELSGSLNLGNNFGTELVRPVVQRDRTPTQGSARKGAQPGAGGVEISATPHGYQVQWGSPADRKHGDS
ncbi:hypothetical protein GCM10010885_19790 [Alicyclobacillus cellulosilyticus]|uniref:Uncharacterized protein n=1 Tax=Alicyclobacillus cellulosilyticus TaxID=1003997 RepID=A0A917NLP6_9BACL|nr:hypothetical protein [Alicyclobacillus cellulosilyticus]GGJ10633.1 hypothetical protein GCM10010885_19790 [Alicyclobacillus cellulosilyticus]